MDKDDDEEEEEEDAVEEAEDIAVEADKDIEEESAAVAKTGESRRESEGGVVRVEEETDAAVGDRRDAMAVAIEVEAELDAPEDEDEEVASVPIAETEPEEVAGAVSECLPSSVIVRMKLAMSSWAFCSDLINSTWSEMTCHTLNT